MLIQAVRIDKCTRVIIALDGWKVKCKCNNTDKIQIVKRYLTLSALIYNEVIDGVEVVMRMSVIDTLGGVMVLSNAVKFMWATCSLMVESDDVSDENFHITERDFFWK